jgi:hypothetical protein
MDGRTKLTVPSREALSIETRECTKQAALLNIARDLKQAENLLASYYFIQQKLLQEVIFESNLDILCPNPCLFMNSNDFLTYC